MKVLKAIICLTLALACALPPAYTARAAVDGWKYARADSRGVYFCSERDDNTALFAVPYTYCVQIISEYDDGWYQVRYGQEVGDYIQITGYCRTAGLTIVDEPPENAFLNYPITTTVRAEVPSDGSLSALEVTVTVAYYGTLYYKGIAAYSYVRYGNSFKYIAGANENYPLNEIPAEPTFSETNGIPDEGNTQLVTALIITAVAAAAIVVLVMTGKRRPDPKKLK